MISNYFFLGMFGSLAVDLVAFASAYDKEEPLPKKYTKVGYYIVRALLALTGGSLVVIYGIDTPFGALQIGASTPALLNALAVVARQAPVPLENHKDRSL